MNFLKTKNFIEIYLYENVATELDPWCIDARKKLLAWQYYFCWQRIANIHLKLQD